MELGDSQILVVGCDGVEPGQGRCPPEMPRGYQFEAADPFDLFRDRLLFDLYEHWSFYDWFDTFAVWSPSGGWLSYLNNRADVGLMSACTEKARTTIETLESEIFLDLAELRDPRSWYYTPIEAGVLDANYNLHG